MKKLIKVRVNGDAHEVAVDTRQTLLQVIRDVLGLMGTKEGCSNGNCGACAVLLDGSPVDSCCVLAIEAEGHEVVTVEGLARDGEMSPLQRAFVEMGALECGYCSPGVLISATALLRDNPKPSEVEIRRGIAGNLCRCTGYDKIVRAIAAASEYS